MSYRFDVPLIAGAYHFGDRGLGVLGSEIASTGTNGPGYLYSDLNLPADANKEYQGRIVTPPGVGTFFAFEDSSFIYSGPSTTFTYKLIEDGQDLGNQVVNINMDAPSGTITWTEDSDITTMYLSAVNYPTSSLTWTEADDNTLANVTLRNDLGMSWTEANDSTNVVASMLASSIMSWTEADDTNNLTVGIINGLAATAAWTEANDTMSITSNVLGIINGSVSWIEADDTHVIGGTVIGITSMSVVWTEANDGSVVVVYAAAGTHYTNIQDRFSAILRPMKYAIRMH